MVELGRKPLRGCFNHTDLPQNPVVMGDRFCIPVALALAPFLTIVEGSVLTGYIFCTVSANPNFSPQDWLPQRKAADGSTWLPLPFHREIWEELVLRL